MELLKRYNNILYVAALIWAGICFLWLGKALLLGYYPDFVTQYNVPKIVFAGGNPYEGGEGLYTPQVYPPITFLFFWPLTAFSLSTASYFYTFFSILSLVTTLLIFFKLYDEKPYSLQSLVLMGLVFMYFPVKFTLGMGQVNHYVLLLLAISLWFLKRRQEFRAGVFLGISIAIKLFPLFLPIYFFIRIRKIPHDFKDKFHWSGLLNFRIFNFKLWIWPSQMNENLRLLFGLGFAIFITIILVILLIPMNLNTQFVFEVLPSLANSWKLDYYNQALSGFVGRSFGTGDLGVAVKLFSSAIISLGALYAVSKNEKIDFLTVSLKFGTLVIVSILINTFSWQHHFVWLVIPLFTTFFYIFKKKLNKKYYLILLSAYFLTAINFESGSKLPVLLQSHVFYGAVILLGLCIRLLFLKEEK